MIQIAAIKHRESGVIVTGIRHGDCYSLYHALCGVCHQKDFIEGFLDRKGNFYDRLDAFKHALSYNQLSPTTLIHKNEHCERELFSEDLW